MTKPMVLAAGLGLAAAVLLILWQGPGSVLGALASVGLGALWITLVRCVQIAGAGFSWWLLLPQARGDLLGACLLLRWVRESINTLLPVAQVGGEIIGALLLAQWRMGGGLAAASVLVDLLLQTATQVVFSVVGLLLVTQMGADGELIFWLSAGLLLLALAVVSFFAAQRLGGFHVLERWFLRLAENPRWRALAGAASLHQGLQIVHDRPRAIVAAGAVHLIVWFIGALEIWIALTYMGFSVGYTEALAIESLGHAVRAAGFLIPGGLGVQEGGFVAICAVLGIPAPVALALSLVKRVPEIVLGLPGLLLWRTLEGRATDAKGRPSLGDTQ